MQAAIRAPSSPCRPARKAKDAMTKLPRLLIIAGSDSGGCAGIQGDIKTASAQGVFATTAITAITAQNTLGVQSVQMMPPDLVQAQIASVLDDIGADAVKIGMLGSAANVLAVTQALRGYAGPVVLDPVMIATSGDSLLDGDAVAAMRIHLMPRATLITPNLPEAARLLGRPVALTNDEAAAQGHMMLTLGTRAVLVKGGHSEGDICTDWLITPAGAMSFSAPRIATSNTHGTGCAIATAIAARLAWGEDLQQAVRHAHHWLHGAILHADDLGIGRGNGPVHHFHALWPCEQRPV